MCRIRIRKLTPETKQKTMSCSCWSKSSSKTNESSFFYQFLSYTKFEIFVQKSVALVYRRFNATSDFCHSLIPWYLTITPKWRCIAAAR